MTEQNGARAKCFDRCSGMGDEQYRSSLIHHQTDSRITLGLKKLVAHRKRLINDEDFGLKMHLHSKSKPHKHATRIGFYRLIKVITDIGEFHNIREFFVKPPFIDSKDRAI